MDPKKLPKGASSKAECLLHAFCMPTAGLLQVEGKIMMLLGQQRPAA
jgi:hypothetical protein